MALNIADLAEHAIDAVPDRVALICGDEQVTYAQLEDKANRLAHYLIVDPTRSLILHHSRTGDAILTRVITEGAIVLAPPGLELALADVYAG